MAKPFFKGFTKTFFVICNILLAVLFLTGAYIQYFNPLHWWFVGVMVLGMPYLILGLLIFFAGWLLAKSFWLVISLVSIALGWQAIKNIFPLNRSTSFSLQKDTGSIRIMSWNVEQFNIQQYKIHPEIKTQMLELINKFKPDIACFQEMVGGDYSRTINYLGDLKRALHFDNYYYSYNISDDFDGKHHFGLITFSRRAFLRKKTISVSPPTYNSTFQYTDLVLGQDTVRVFNIHLQSLKFSPGNLHYLDKPDLNIDTTFTESMNIMRKLKMAFLKRGKQAERVKAEVNKSPYPVIICGDFNDVPNSYAYNIIGKNLRNAFVEKGSGIGRTFTLISPTLRIDNIFTDKKFVVNQFGSSTKKLIDHFPVVADVTFIRPAN